MSPSQRHRRLDQIARALRNRIPSRGESIQVRVDRYVATLPPSDVLLAAELLERQARGQPLTEQEQATIERLLAPVAAFFASADAPAADEKGRVTG